MHAQFVHIIQWQKPKLCPQVNVSHPWGSKPFKRHVQAITNSQIIIIIKYFLEVVMKLAGHSMLYLSVVSHSIQVANHCTTFHLQFKTDSAPALCLLTFPIHPFLITDMSFLRYFIPPHCV